jgi:perosamine synthetase
MQLIYWWKNFNFFYEDNIKKTKILKEFNPNYNYIEILEKKISKLLKKKYVIFTTSGSSALILALHSLGLKKKVNVLVPNRTWVATAHSAYILNHTIKLAEVNKSTMNFDINNTNHAALKKVNILISVNINGKNCELDKSIKKKITIIEDCAQSFLSTRARENKRIKISCYSTGTTKLINTFQGGFCATNNQNLYKKILLSRNHGVNNQFTDKWKMAGFNFKPTNLQCFIGLQELKNIRKKKKNCIKIFNLYISGVVSDKVKIFNPQYSKNEFPIYVFAIVKNKTNFIRYMKKKKIQIRHLPPSLSSAKYFLKSNKKIIFHNSDFFYNNFVYLPCGPSQKIKDINRVIKVINNY